MKKEKVMELPLGLYKIYWKSGGHSLASVGMLHDGNRWFAPTNWTSKNTDRICSTDWKSVKKVKLLKERKY